MSPKYELFIFSRMKGDGSIEEIEKIDMRDMFDLFNLEEVFDSCSSLWRFSLLALAVAGVSQSSAERLRILCPQLHVQLKNSKDSILKMSEQGTKQKNSSPSNASPSSSRKSKTRGPGKKTIERQATMALDP